MIDLLNDDNFMMYAIKNYNTVNCIMSELIEDLKRIKYIKRLMKRYRNGGPLKESLILNHIIILGNVFGTKASVHILFFKLGKEYRDMLKTFFIFLNYFPEKLDFLIDGEEIHLKEIPIDMKLASVLRKIK